MNLFDLMAKISLDTSEYDDGLQQSEKKGKTFAKSIGDGLKKAGKFIAVGAAAGGAAVAALTTSAVRAYADYEQLSGGVEKLFGKDASFTMMKYAQDAYRTAGMSANQFMEQSTSFAAALIQSYEGDAMEAANQANKAMMAISDNFNTFGGDISSVQSAFQGFAKQNYTMLDNLKLGYGGTKTEMERLIADANEYAEANGLAADLSIEKFGDIVEAIDLIQQKQGIAGTTAKEAATTISGSIGMMKAAWQNLLVAFSDKDADLSQYFNALTTSAETAFKNILPVAEQAIKGIGQFVADVIPTVAQKIPGLVSEVLPSLVTAGTSLLTAIITGIASGLPLLVEAIPDVIAAVKDGLVQSWPAIKETGKTLVNVIGEGIVSAKDWVVEKATEIWDSIVDSLPSSWDGIKEKASGLWDALKEAFDSIKESVESLADLFSPITDAISGYIKSGDLAADATGLFEGALSALTTVVDGLGTGISTAIDGITDFVNWLSSGSDGAEAFKAVVVGLTAAVAAYGATVLVSNGYEAARVAVTKLVTGAQELLNAVMSMNPIGLIIAAIAALVAAFIYLWNTSEDFRNFWIDLWDGIKSAAKTVVSAVSGFFSSLGSSIISAWNTIRSGVASAWDSIKSTVSNSVNNIKSAVSSAFTSIKSTASSIWNGIKSTISTAINSAKSTVHDAIEKIKGFFNFSWSLPKLKLPHFSITGSFSLNPPSVPSFGISWYKKAYENPYLFSKPTIVGAMGFGDGNGAEMVYGRDALMRDIREAVAREMPKTIKMYLDGDKLVGGTSDRMDNNLGQKQVYQLRWEGA